MYICTSMCVYIYTHIHIYTHNLIRIYIYVYTYVHKNVYNMHMYIDSMGSLALELKIAYEVKLL